MIQEKVKGLFIQEGEVKNINLDTGCVDQRVIQDSAVENIHLKNGEITIEKFSTDIQKLLLPNSNIYYALSNSYLPSGDNPYVTRREVFSYKSNWRDAVQNYSDLPTLKSGINKENDTRLVSSEKKIYLWKDNVWTEISTSSSSSIDSKLNQGMFLYTYSFTLNKGSEYVLEHDSDYNFSRIIQIKERISGEEISNVNINFSEGNSYYIKSSFYSLDNVIITISSTQITGSFSTTLNPGIIGLVGEDKDNVQYKISYILTQNDNNLPPIIYINKPLQTSYNGVFYISNIIINSKEASIVRQKNQEDFTILRNTSRTNKSASNIKVFSSKESGISYVLSIREDNTIVCNYLMQGRDEWLEYNVNYKFGQLEFPVKANQFSAVHIITKYKDTSNLMDDSNNLDGNDMFGLAYLDQGTNRPYFISWCHNFGTPIFFPRKNLDSEGNSYSDIDLFIREIIYFKDIPLNYEISNKFDYSYVVGITASQNDSNGYPHNVAFWVNLNATKNLQLWPENISPKIINGLYSEGCKILLTPQLSTEIFSYEYKYVWSSKNFSIWIIYRNTKDSSINALLIKKSSSDPNTDYVFEASEDIKSSKMIDLNENIEYNHQFLFSNYIDNFICNNKNDFSVAIWEDYIEPGLLYTDDKKFNLQNKSIHLRGTPVVAASNFSLNKDKKSNEILLSFKHPSVSSEWYVQKTSKYGNNLKILVEKKYERNFDHKIYSNKCSNSDNIHVFYINKDSERLECPCHIHNRCGSWENEHEDNSILSYEYRIRNFSDPLEYLNYIDITDFDFKLDELGQVEFSAFYDSSDSSLRGLYYSKQDMACKYSIWSSPEEPSKSGPGPRAGFTSFYYKNYVYIQGGYGMNGSIDTSMWRYNLNTNQWEVVSVENPPPRVFHISDIIENVAYKGILGNQYHFSEAVPTPTPDGDRGIDFSEYEDPINLTGKYYHLWIKPSKFGISPKYIKYPYFHKKASYFEKEYKETFYEFFDSIDPYIEKHDKCDNPNLPYYSDKENLTNKVKTIEGYRDSIINFEIYNLTSGSHGIIQDISVCHDNLDNSICVQVKGLTGGSRTDSDQYLEGDQIVISYPGRPEHDQIVIYGGGSYNPSRSNGYPDDLDGGVSWPPDSVSISGDMNIGDNQSYKDARTIFISDINDSLNNKIIFRFMPLAKNGSSYAPVPCISGSLVITGYTRDSLAGISRFPNFMVFNRSNSYRFQLNYEQDSNLPEKPFGFLGRWSKLDPLKASNGSPIEGITSWRGAKIKYYGGIKPAPKGHSQNPYVENIAMIYFGGFTTSDYTNYYDNTLLIIGAQDVNVGWAYIKNLTDDIPKSRNGNGIAIINRNIEIPPIVDNHTDGKNYIEYIKKRDLDNEIWIACGNNDDINPRNYITSKSLDDIWCGKLNYTRRKVNLSTLNRNIDFVKKDNDYTIISNLKLSSLFVVPNGLRCSNNELNSLAQEKTISIENDRFDEFSIYDSTNFDDFDLYSGSDKITESHPDWIHHVYLHDDGITISGDSRIETEIDGIYWPSNGSPIGERRWTIISKLTITIPGGPGSGDHVVYVGVYNSGINSYVEYFIPNSSYFAFNLAFIELSGGQYNPDPTIRSGKSWFDSSTGTLHIQIINTLHQSFSTNYIPYISKIENTHFLELTGVNWKNYSTDVGIKPYKNTWGALVTDSENRGIYFGGRTHGKTVIDNLLKWNSPSVFIQNEKSDIYRMEEIDGSDKDKYISLKHKNIVKENPPVKIGEVTNYNLELDSYYSIWGIAKITLNLLLLGKYMCPIYYCSFYVKPRIRYNDLDNNVPAGLGYIEFENIDTFKLLIYSNFSSLHTEPENVYYDNFIFKGIFNYDNGKLYINTLEKDKDDENIYFYLCKDNLENIGDGKIISSTEFKSTLILNYEEDELIGKLLYIPRSSSSSFTGVYVIESNNLDTITISGSFDKFSDEDETKNEISNNVFITDMIIPTDILIELVDINYHTKDHYNNSYYKTNISNHLVRYIGDKIGGEYSSRIPSWVHTQEIYVDTETASRIRDDRTRMLTYNTEVYDNSICKKIIGKIIATDQFQGSGFVINEFAGKILTITSKYSELEGNYKILSNTETIITLDSSPESNVFPSSSSENIDVYIMKNYISISDITGETAYIPNTYINVPNWVLNELKNINSLYDSPGNSNLIKIIDVLEDKQAYCFGKIIFRKENTNIEYYQYFILYDEGFEFIKGDELILKKDNILKIYDATEDDEDLKLIYISDMTDTTVPHSYFDVKFDLSTVSEYDASIAGFEIEINTATYNNKLVGSESLKMPIEIYDPSTYMQWQDTQIKLLFSFDDGLTWKKYNSDMDLWFIVDSKDIMEQGMEFSELSNILSWPWSGWNNYLRHEERNIPQAYLGFIEGITNKIKVFIGMNTNEPAFTPSINNITMNLYTGGYWEPKNFNQKGTSGNDREYLQVKMVNPNSTIIKNNHGTDNTKRKLIATIVLNKNI